MEPVGFAIGVVGLAGLFSTCMECFDYIQLGRAFGSDYGKCLLRLDAAKVRFSRWGEATGIVPTTQAAGQLQLSDQEYRLAESLLRQIHDLFDDSQSACARYQKHARLSSSTSDALVVYDDQQDLNSQDLKLHSHLRAIALRRQKSTSLDKKARWALYEKKKFDNIISEIAEFADRLVNLFPPSGHLRRLSAKLKSRA